MPLPVEPRARDEGDRDRNAAHAGTTADVYAHLTPVIQKRAASRMDAILGTPKAASSG